MADEDILGYAQIGEKTRMLVHHGNPSALRLKRRPVLDGDFLDEDSADIRPVDSRQQFYAGAFPCAVLAKQSEHLSTRQIE